ncbi:MAG TPA: methionine--tRNA ligase [Thermoanaerobaculia bacterium]|jgi:methionyl-tRNA synthetase
MPPFYVTTPIYYVNDLPHIGHIFTTVVADTVARYRRLVGGDVRFLTGTDEHGQKIERAARKEGLRPIALADRVVARYHELWRRLEISHDDFVRTTEPRHEAAVAALLAAMERAGDLYLAKHEGFYCTGCETFYTEKELTQPGNRCPDHGTPTEWKSEENLFFRLSRYESRLLALYDEQPSFVRPESRLNEVRAFVASGLKDLSVSRFGLDWGVPFPGHAGHSVWVWLDALTNYISALGYGGDEEGELFVRYWRSAGVRLHLVGKDILRFHAVFWPAFLMSAGLPLPTCVWAHGWWLRDERKMSKSVGNVVRPDHLIERFGADSLRYFLLREMVFGLDASFSDEGFVDRFNADLANDLGNTTSRLVTLSRQAFDGKTPPVACDDNPILVLSREVLPIYREAMERLAFQDALRALWRLLAEANQYLVAREPWKKIRREGPSEGLSRVLWNGLEAVRLVATGLLPMMPETAARVLAAIGVGEPPTTLDVLVWGGLPRSAPLPEPVPIFPRIDKKAFLAELAGDADAPAPAARPAEEGNGMIDIDQFLSVELKIGKVLACESLPKTEKLLKLSVDLGEPSGPRQIVAGIAKAYRSEELVGTDIVVVANLKPAKLMGHESQGMLLAAIDPDGRPIVVRPHQAGALPGARVR